MVSSVTLAVTMIDDLGDIHARRAQFQTACTGAMMASHRRVILAFTSGSLS